jgi:MYXO-CTERM domain-containing protein
VEGTASGGTGGVALVELRIQRSSDGFYWDGAAWGVAVTDLTATGTTTWLYLFAAAEGEVYTVTVRATDGAAIVQDPPTTGAFGIGAAPVVARKARYHFKCAAGAEPGSPWLVLLFAALATAAMGRRRSRRAH